MTDVVSEVEASVIVGKMLACSEPLDCYMPVPGSSLGGVWKQSGRMLTRGKNVGLAGQGVMDVR